MTEVAEEVLHLEKLRCWGRPFSHAFAWYRAQSSAGKSFGKYGIELLLAARGMCSVWRRRACYSAWWSKEDGSACAILCMLHGMLRLLSLLHLRSSRNSEAGSIWSSSRGQAKPFGPLLGVEMRDQGRRIEYEDWRSDVSWSMEFASWAYKHSPLPVSLRLHLLLHHCNMVRDSDSKLQTLKPPLRTLAAPGSGWKGFYILPGALLSALGAEYEDCQRESSGGPLKATQAKWGFGHASKEPCMNIEDWEYWDIVGIVPMIQCFNKSELARTYIGAWSGDHSLN